MSTPYQNMGIPMTQKQYAEEWEQNSKYFKETDSYDWMASEIGQTNRVLEVGCGVGYSTLSLAKKSTRKIFVIESNVTLAEKASLMLKKNNISVSISNLQDRFVEVDCRVQIIIGSINDKKIDSLISEIDIDCIVCWLIGAAPETVAELFNLSVYALQPENMSKYREITHKRCYQLGFNGLKGKAIVSIIDRAGLEKIEDIPNVKKYWSDFHSKLSEKKFESESINVKVLDLSFATSEIQYVINNPNAPKILTLNSVVMRKI